MATAGGLGAVLRSQAANMWLMRGLWSPTQLLRGLRLPVRWALSRDGSAPPPLALAWYVTYACPETCSFCNVTQVVEDWQQPLAVATRNALVDRLVPRIPTVAIGGGEPLVLPGILDLVERIRHRGGRVFLVTSATTLGPARARRLAALAPEVVTVSLLGEEAEHDAVMGRVGAWQRAVGGVEALLSARDPRRTKVLLNCVLGLDQPRDPRALLELAQRLGVDGLRLTWLSFMTPDERTADAHAATYLVVPEERLAAFDTERLLSRVAETERAAPGFVQTQPRLSAVERAGWYAPGGGVARRCASLWHTLFLRPDASVVPCGHLFDDSVGRLVDHDGAPLDLAPLWNDPALRAIRRAQWGQPFAACRRCCKT